MRKTTKQLHKELNKWRDSPCLQIGRVDMLKTFLPYLIDRHDTHPNQNPNSYLVTTNKPILMKRQKVLTTSHNIKQEHNECGGIYQ